MCSCAWMIAWLLVTSSYLSSSPVVQETATSFFVACLGVSSAFRRSTMISEHDRYVFVADSSPIKIRPETEVEKRARFQECLPGEKGGDLIHRTLTETEDQQQTEISIFSILITFELRLQFQQYKISSLKIAVCMIGLFVSELNCFFNSTSLIKFMFRSFIQSVSQEQFQNTCTR